MLKLTNIIKEYLTGSEKVSALKGVSMSFRKSEFVSILGPSGCGKTTLLNIVGGLDRYTSGDLVINGKSTKDFKDSDWDTYRNHSIGFVFQSYNLIPHQTVLRNVELALTLSGVNKEERRQRAIEALERVGLGDQLKKRPTQMSGGQMQRVAIARALVNNPDILLADEPTGALDSVTSVQIMDLLKEISKDKLIIMVTHNGDLAEEYSSRIIRLQDGLVIGDTNPYSEEEFARDEKELRKEMSLKAKEEKVKEVKKGKKSMSFLTALALSFNNLMTKKGRTILTALAGSIGIIGIALILSLSNGIQSYIDKVQEETLSSYPVQIDAETADLSSILNSMMSSSSSSTSHPKDQVYANSSMLDLMNSLNELGTQTNNLEAFKAYLEANPDKYNEYVSAIRYTYNLDLHIYSSNTANGITKANPSEIMSIIMELMYGVGSSTSSSYASMMGGNMSVFCEIIPPLDEKEGHVNSMLKSQYELVDGHWPENKNEIVLILDKNNEISDLALFSLGIKDQEEFKEGLKTLLGGGTIEATQTTYTYEEIRSYKYKLVLPTAYYEHQDKKWIDRSKDETYMKNVVLAGEELTISGIIRPTEDSASTALTGSIGYTSALTEWYIEEINKQKIVIDQKADPTIDVISGLPFATKENTPQNSAERLVKINEYFANLDESIKTATKSEIYTNIYITPTEEEIDEEFAKYKMLLQMQGKTLRDAMLEAAGKFWQNYVDKINQMSDEEVERTSKEQARPQLVESVKARKEQDLNDKNLTPEMKASELDKYIEEATNEQIDDLYKNYIPSKVSSLQYEDVLNILGVVDINSPKSIFLYAIDFEGKDKIQSMVNEYNSGVIEDDQIKYTDYVALIMSGVSDIINAISYVLIGFVSISLVVSSIMIGIITYISVLERTKEIGILRAIGASKRDISRVFNAETLIEGFASGFLGIATTLLICIPLNAILFLLSDIASLKAELPTSAAIILILISMFLTFIAGLIPSRVAAKKDPVEALRTE